MNALLSPTRCFLALSALTLVACSKPADKGPSNDVPSGKATGLAAVDAKIAGLARKAAACKSYETGFDTSCSDWKAWNEAKDDFNEGKADGDLVDMLEDDDAKIRNLGAMKLNGYGKSFKTDKALASRVLAAAEKERSTFAAYDVGAATGRIKVRETGLDGRIKALLRKPEMPALRRGILGNLLFSNNDYNVVYDMVRDTVKDPDKAVALSALGSFWVGGSSRPTDTCALYATNVNNPVDELSAEASNALSWYRKCSSKYDGLLDSLEKRAKAGKVPSSSFSTAIGHMCEPEGQANDAQKKKGAEIAHTIVQAKVPGWVRASALDSLVKCDAKGFKSFLKKMAKDPDAAVKAKATELLAKK